MKHVLYFSAPWCAPCKSFAPQFSALMDQHSEVTYEKVNIDEDFEKARTHGVRAIPCVVVLVEDKETGRLAGGAVTKPKLEQLLS